MQNSLADAQPLENKEHHAQHCFAVLTNRRVSVTAYTFHSCRAELELQQYGNAAAVLATRALRPCVWQAHDWQLSL